MHRVICDFLLEIVQNAAEADSTAVSVSWRQEEKQLSVAVEDNGRGMAPEEIRRLEDPYFTDGRKHVKRAAGLGIPFLVQTLDMTGGRFGVESEPGIGTKVSFTFPLDHIDTPPVGSIPEAFAVILSMDGNYELSIRREQNPGGSYSISRSELTEALGELESADSQILLRKYLESCESELTGP